MCLILQTFSESCSLYKVFLYISNNIRNLSYCERQICRGRGRLLKNLVCEKLDLYEALISIMYNMSYVYIV